MSDITLRFISVCTLRMARVCNSLRRMYTSAYKSHKTQSHCFLQSLPRLWICWDTVVYWYTQVLHMEWWQQEVGMPQSRTNCSRPPWHKCQWCSRSCVNCTSFQLWMVLPETAFAWGQRSNIIWGLANSGCHNLWNLQAGLPAKRTPGGWYTLEQHIGGGSCNLITMDAAKPVCHHAADMCHVKSSATMGQPQGESGRVHFPSCTSAKSKPGTGLQWYHLRSSSLFIIEDKIKALGGSDLKTFGLPDPQLQNDNDSPVNQRLLIGKK